MASLRPCPEDGVKLIKLCEGFEPRPYICPAGVLSIGYGHVVKPGEDWSRGITEAEADALLREELGIYENGVLRHIRVPLSDDCYAALTSFTYNLGIGALESSTMRRMINNGQLYEAADQFPRWVFGGGKKLPGLVKRRELSRALWLRGLHGSNGGPSL